MTLETTLFFGILLLVTGLYWAFRNSYKGLDLTSKNEDELNKETQIYEEVEPLTKIEKPKRVYKRKPKVKSVTLDKVSVNNKISKKQ